MQPKGTDFEARDPLLSRQSARVDKIIFVGGGTALLLAFVLTVRDAWTYHADRSPMTTVLIAVLAVCMTLIFAAGSLQFVFTIIRVTRIKFSGGVVNIDRLSRPTISIRPDRARKLFSSRILNSTGFDVQNCVVFASEGHLFAVGDSIERFTDVLLLLDRSAGKS